MPNADITIVRRWIDAFYAYRDDELMTLAHPDIEVRPRAGQGPRLVEGHDELRSWLASLPQRSNILEYDLSMLPDGRVLAEATLEGLSVVGLFNAQDGQIRRVVMYVSDRQMLEQFGEIEFPADVDADPV